MSFPAPVQSIWYAITISLSLILRPSSEPWSEDYFNADQHRGWFRLQWSLNEKLKTALAGRTPLVIGFDNVPSEGQRLFKVMLTGTTKANVNLEGYGSIEADAFILNQEQALDLNRHLEQSALAIKSSMTKWEYGLAYYDDGLIEAHPEYMNDMQGAPQNIAHFLEMAGEKGWEMCSLLPGKTDKPHDTVLVFKRPLEQ
jgi:hypothetical protein